MSVRRAELLSGVARRLITDLNAELSDLYPEPGANHFRLDANEVAEGRGAFVIASRGEEAVGCGALRLIDDATGELKRMYVIPSERGRGVGRAVLEHLENEARAMGMARLLLETGIRQHAAIALYERAGFVRIPPYGEYVLSAATSICMQKLL